LFSDKLRPIFTKGVCLAALRSRAATRNL
jgi:hypothetical protein